MNSSRFSSFLFLVGMLMCLPEILVEVTSISTIAFLRGQMATKEDTNNHRHPGTFSSFLSNDKHETPSMRFSKSRLNRFHGDSAHSGNPRPGIKKAQKAPTNPKPGWNNRHVKKNPTKPPTPTSKPGSRKTHRQTHPTLKYLQKHPPVQVKSLVAIKNGQPVANQNSTASQKRRGNSGPTIAPGEWGVDDAITNTHVQYNFDGFTSENTCDLCQVATIATKNVGCTAAQMISTDICLSPSISDLICSIPIIECTPVCIFAFTMVIDGDCETLTNNIYSTELDICSVMGFCGPTDEEVEDEIMDDLTDFTSVSYDKQPPLDPEWYGTVASDPEFLDPLWWKHGFFADDSGTGTTATGTTPAPTSNPTPAPTSK